MKKEYYQNLDMNIFIYTRTISKNIQPLFSDKLNACEKVITLIEDDAVISDEKAVAEKLNNYFDDIMENLDIEPFIETTDCEINVIEDKNAIKYKKHPSILKIKEHVTLTTNFYFSKPTSEFLSDHLERKPTVENDIPTKNLIDTKEIAIQYFSNIYHKSFVNQICPNIIKIADVIPTHKKFERTSKKNYHPISLLPSVSKIYKRDMYNQILIYVENHLSPYLFGIRKGHSTKQCLNIMLENWLWTVKVLLVQY